MAINVLIKRRFKDEYVHEAHYHNAEIRALATVQPGYISGKTIINIEDPKEMIVVSKWSSKEDWDNWYKTPERQAFYKKLRLSLEAGEKISFYESAAKK